MKRGAGYFLIEFIIVTLGVSISLVLNDWREDRKNQELEIQILGVVLSNLEMDSTIVENHHKGLDVFSRSTRKLLEGETEITLDSFNIYLDHITSYSKLQTIDVGFRELSSSGIQLQNDSLARQLLSYYTAIYNYVEEWNSISSDFILHEMIPYLINDFPELAVAEGQVPRFAVKEVPGPEVLSDSRFNNLLVTNLIYQQSMRVISEVRQERLQALLRNTRSELKRLKKE